MYFRISSTVTLSPTVRAKYPSSQNSPPHNSFFTSGYSLNITPALIPFNIPTTFAMLYRAKYMHMICGNLHRVYFKFMMLGYLPKYFSCSFPYFSSQYPLAIFRCPNQMIFGIIHCMACSFKSHAFSYIISLIAFGKKLFIPAYKAGYSSFEFS